MDTNRTNKSNDEDTAKAIQEMRDISKAMNDDRQTLIAHKDAAESSAKSAQKASEAGVLQAESSLILAKSGAVSANAAVKQLGQSAKLFAVQQRPVIEWDNNKLTEFGPITLDSTTRWNYAYKNVGLGPAFQITIFSTIFINGKQAVTEKVIGPAELFKEAYKWRTAEYKWLGIEGSAPWDSSYRLLLRFRYYDALGNQYWTIICRHHNTNGSIGDCSADYEPRAGKELRKLSIKIK